MSRQENCWTNTALNIPWSVPAAAALSAWARIKAVWRLVTVVTIKMTAEAVSKKYRHNRHNRHPEKGTNRMKSVQIPSWSRLLIWCSIIWTARTIFDEEIGRAWNRSLTPYWTDSSIPSTRPLPPKKNGNRQGREYLARHGVPQSYRWTTPPWELWQERATLLLLADKAKALADTAPRISSSPSKNLQSLRWMAERFPKSSLPVGGSVAANSIAERLTVTPWIFVKWVLLANHGGGFRKAAFPCFLGERNALWRECQKRGVTLTKKPAAAAKGIPIIRPWASRR